MRRAGVEKIGYFPIPPEMMHWIASQLVIPAGATISLVDPCMGEGVALNILKEFVKSRQAEVLTYGCEISRERYATAVQTILNERREGISRLLNGPAEFLDVSKFCFSLVYLNPPFDERGKEQNRWLELVRDWLIPGGWLVFITTEELALRQDTQLLLNRSYEDVACYRYPAEHRHYQEVVVFARRRQSTQREGLRLLYAAESLNTLTLDEHLALTVPSAKAPPRFSMTVPDMEGSLSALRETGISTTESWQRLTRPDSLSGKWQPLLALSDGHIANLISSGAFDGTPIDDPDLGRCLITGYGSKEKGEAVVEVDEDGITEKTTVTEIPVVHLAVMNLDTGEVNRFSTRDPGKMESFVLRHLHTLKGAIGDTLKPTFDVDTMLDAYLPFVPHFKAPGVLPGATRLRLADGTRLRVTKKLDDHYLAVDDTGVETEASKSDVAHIYQNMLPAQVIKAAAMAYALQHTTTSVIEVGEMGVGKTSTGMLTLYLYLARELERVRQPLADNLRKLGEAEADLLEAQGAQDTAAVRRLSEAVREAEKVIRAMFKIVVICPGHLVNKWAREAAANFSEIRVNGEPARVILPGRVPRRSTHYEVIGNRVLCPDCGTVADLKLSAKDKLKGLSLQDKLLRTSRLKCHNPKCGHWLIQTLDDCAVEDIDEAFAAPGLTVLVLSKEDAKLGASWEAAYIPRRVAVRDDQGHYERLPDGHLKTTLVAACPTCGAILMDKKGEGPLPLSTLTDPDNPKKYTCKAKVQRVKREEGKVVTKRQTGYEYRGTCYAAGLLPEGVEPRHRVQVERDVPVMEAVPCGTPFFTFKRLTSIARKGQSKPRNTYGAWSRGDILPNYGSARWELAKIIARRHRGQYLLILDECHQFKARDSIQGKAMQWLIQGATRTIALTGTVFGGKASSLFYLLYRLSPKFRESFGWRSCERFVDLYGVHEYTTTQTRVDAEGVPSAFGAHVKKTERTEEGNGVDPSIIRWLLSIGVFLTLNDLGIALPEKEEQVHFLTPELELAAGLHRLGEIRQEAAKLAARGNFSLFSAWMQAALGWCLSPDQDEIYIAPEHRKEIARLLDAGRLVEAEAYEREHQEVWAEAVPFTADRPEGEITREIADACLADWQQAGDRSVVYVAGIKRPANKHLYQAMKRRGLRAFILATPGDEEVVKWCDKADFVRCELEDREAVIADALEHKDINVLIVNPPLVATGLDLVIFNRLHFCGVPTYSVYTFEQSMCRLHRPGQQKKVSIHFWVYGANPQSGSAKDNELQALAMAVLSDKVRASAVVSGSVGAALAALNQQNGDIMTTLRDLLLKDEGASLALHEVSEQVAVAVTRTVNPLYARIEAQLETYDDARRPIMVEIPNTMTLPAPSVIQPAQLALVAATSEVTEAIEPAAAPGVEPEHILAGVEDPLLRLLVDLGGVLTDVTDTSLRLPHLVPPVKKAAARHRQRTRFTDAPIEGPTPRTSPTNQPTPVPTPLPLPIQQADSKPVPRPAPLRKRDSSPAQLALF